VENLGRGEQEVASSTNKDDIAFSYGGGAGVMIRLFEQDEASALADSSLFRDLSLDLGVRYVAGERAEYLTNGSVRRSGTNVSYDAKSSRTDMIVAMLGVTFRF
jgi:hypothetical protein